MEKTKNKEIDYGTLIEEKTFKLLKEVAKEKGKTPNILLNEMLERETSPFQEFEENGQKFERFMLDLPKPIAKYYRALAYLRGIENLPESLIVFDIADHLNAYLEGITSASVKDLFNLDKALQDTFGREHLLLGTLNSS